MTTPTAEQTILLVDEDLDYLDWATRHLKAEGVHILRCDNGENAIKVTSYVPTDARSAYTIHHEKIGRPRRVGPTLAIG